ncbi:MAG: alpha/beta fold hydrolase [Verrucomicrobiaceae bacterium]|nr:alpha/beta fold hydrolase [Verrucomicrobiaceae bacterium]
MSLCRRLLRLLLIVSLTPVVFLLSCQSKLIYHPRSYGEAYVALLRQAKGHRIHYQTTQGAQTAFFIPPRHGDARTAPLWLCFSGNGSLALDWLRVNEAWDSRYAYLLIDYPSYGDCAGKPTPKNIRESSTAAFAALAMDLGQDADSLKTRTLVLGHSLGAAAALMATEDLKLHRGVLIAPFTSMTDMGRVVLGWPLCYLNMHRFDNRTAMQATAGNGPAQFILLHGTDDEVIPIRMSRELAASHKDMIRLQELPGMHHNDILHLATEQIATAMDRVAAK